jgi:sulfofructose kinase
MPYNGSTNDYPFCGRQVVIEGVKLLQYQRRTSRNMARKADMSQEITRADVLCVGLAVYDLTFAIPVHPPLDDKTRASSLVSCGGGPAANAAVTIARLGRKAALLGYLGDDIYGDNHYRELQEAGVDVHLVQRGSIPTTLAVILVKPDGKRSIVYYRASDQQLSYEGINLEGISPKVILFDGHEASLSLPLAAYAREHAIPTVLDAGSLHPGTQELASMVDYLVCSEKFARQVTGQDDELQALERLIAYAPSVVITLGERGLVWKYRDGQGLLPVYRVEVVDTTGAGDIFHGAFAACLASGCEWEYTLRYASAAAALSCTRRGARLSIPTDKEVGDFLSR